MSVRSPWIAGLAAALVLVGCTEAPHKSPVTADPPTTAQATPWPSTPLTAGGTEESSTPPVSTPVPTGADDVLLTYTDSSAWLGPGSRRLPMLTLTGDGTLYVADHSEPDAPVPSVTTLRVPRQKVLDLLALAASSGVREGVDPGAPSHIFDDNTTVLSLGPMRWEGTISAYALDQQFDADRGLTSEQVAVRRALREVVAAFRALAPEGPDGWLGPAPTVFVPERLVVQRSRSGNPGPKKVWSLPVPAVPTKKQYQTCAILNGASAKAAADLVAGTRPQTQWHAEGSRATSEILVRPVIPGDPGCPAPR
ncbi:MAG: hypothetical protein LCH77_04515 [Actinobacteria bacterium]|nr:hypothetical protein [Actinomycetota bacterium]